MVPAIELDCASYYSFLEGASSPEALAQRAGELGMPALALTDRNGLYGASLFARACEKEGVRPIFGARLGEALFLCKDQTGYQNLSQLLTEAQRGAPKGEATASWEQIRAYKEGLICLAQTDLDHYGALFAKEDLYVPLTLQGVEGDLTRCRKLRSEAQARGLGCVATGQTRYARPQEGPLLDVLTCIKHRTTLRMSEAVRALNHLRYLKPPSSPWPDALANTHRIAKACAVQLDFSAYRFPDFPVPDGLSAHAYLMQLCLARLPKPHMRTKLLEELALIEKLGMSGYFLVVWDLVEFARKKGICAQGRGSAANSLVAYVLGITPVDPLEHDLFLGRFIHDEMTAIPDIDLDFAATRQSGRADREDVIQYVYDRYGADHVAMVSTFVTFRRRSAVREVGRVLEVPQPLIDGMAKVGFEPYEEFLATHTGKQLLQLCEAIADVPRHLSIHVGGMLIASRPISHMVPLEPTQMERRVVCQWDKDMVDDAGLIKVDILSLGMLGVLGDLGNLLPADLTFDDPEVYKVLARADTVGLFQVESRAQMQSLPRTQPKTMAELAIQVAIIRPGPLQGSMVSPYIRRKAQKEAVTYPHPCLEPVLKETLGVILFQEQVLKVATAMAGFTPSQAEGLRRAMSRKRSQKAMAEIEADFMQGAVARGIPLPVARHTFSLLEGFALYGFCKSHALSFASITYRSAWLRKYHPAHFVAALLNNQPMGFYTPAVILQDAKRHGVQVFPVDINQSAHRTTVHEEGIRLGLMTVKGVKQTQEIARGRPYSRLEEIPTDDRSLERLIQAGALDSLVNGRRSLLWELWANRHKASLLRLTVPELPHQSGWDKLVSEYNVMGLCAAAHPFQYLRTCLDAQGIASSQTLEAAPAHTALEVAGLIVSRQKPPTAKGFCFLTLEDEVGLMNIIVPPALYEKHKPLIKSASLLLVWGHKQAHEGVINLMSSQLRELIII